MAVEGAAGTTVPIRARGTTWTKYRIVDSDDTSHVVVGPVTTGITYTASASKANAALPGAGGEYEIQWDDGSGAWAATEDLTVTGDANFTIASSPWPVSTVVSLYVDRNEPAGSTGQPPGSAIQTATVASSGSVTFTNLTAGTHYIAAAQVGGTWKRVKFLI